MSTTRITLRATPRRRSATALTAAALLVAVGVAVPLLALGANQRKPLTTNHHAMTSATVIQHRAGGAQPANLNPATGHGGAVLNTATGQMHGGAGPSPANALGAQTTFPAPALPGNSHWAGP